MLRAISFGFWHMMALILSLFLLLALAWSGARSGRPACWQNSGPGDCSCRRHLTVKTITIKEETFGNKASFGFDIAKLTTEQEQILAEVIKRTAAGMKVTSTDIVGYADPIGGVAHNWDLSGRRAQGVRDAIALFDPALAASAHVSAGGVLKPAGITTDQCPALPYEDRKACYADWRRVEVKLVGPTTITATEDTSSAQDCLQPDQPGIK